MASLSEIAFPPESHPLYRDYIISHNSESITIPKNMLALEYKSNTTTDGIPPLPLKPQLTEEEKKIRNEEVARKLKEELALVIIDESVNEMSQKDVDDLLVIRTEFELIYIPNETDTGKRTFIQNYNVFEKLTNNSFVIPMIFMSVMLDTIYQKIDTTDGVMWAFERECTPDEVEQAKYQYIDDMLMCTDCNSFNSTIVKNSNNELVRICSSSNCNSVRIIEYTKSDDDVENASRQFMMSEILQNVPIYHPITVHMEKIEPTDSPTKPSEDKIKLCELMQSIMDGKIDPLLQPQHYHYNGWNYDMSPNKMHYNSHFHKFPNGTDLGNNSFRNTSYIPNNVHVPAGYGSISQATGYNVTRYGDHFNKPSVISPSNSGISSGYVQTLSQAKQDFGLQYEDDERKYFTYNNSKKDKFQAYLRFMIDKINEQSKTIAKESYGKTGASIENNLGFAPVVLLKKAKELDCVDVAVMANVMYLFDENIIKSNQLINKRKYLLPFINSSTVTPETIGVFFLIGIEYLIENNENELMTSADKIMKVALQQKYFDLEAFDKWMAIENNHITTQDFSIRLRRYLVSWRNETDDTTDIEQLFNEDNSEVSDNEVKDNEVDDNEIAEEIDIITMETSRKFNTDLFVDNDKNKYQSTKTHDLPPSYNEATSSQHYAFVFNPKTVAIENTTTDRLIKVD
jgi:hypothetical protein